MTREIKLSVREFIERILRSGDIDTGFLTNQRALQGTYLHQKIQKQYPSTFKKEVLLSMEKNYDFGTLILEGRCDGLEKIGEDYLIDEIKSTIHSEEELKTSPNQLHWAQLKCYGYMLCKKEGLESVTLQLTYITLGDETIFHFKKEYKREELEDYFNKLLANYLEIQKDLEKFYKISIESIKNLEFPFKTFRKGQREMSVAVYNMIQDRGRLLIEAPTGIGKTLATLFPGIKAIGEGLHEKIFYATGRGTQKEIAKKTHLQLMDKGLRLKSLVLTAKETICLNEEVRCNPIDCPYAKGHFDRVDKVLIKLFKEEDVFDFKTIRKYAEEGQVCPFELQLDLTHLAQLIIGDYNYLYHPRGLLESFFNDSTIRKETTLLVDEAHNLVDRGRAMYSLELGKELIEPVLDLDFCSSKTIERLSSLIETISEYSKISEVRECIPKKLNQEINRLIANMETYLSEKDRELPEEFIELYFRLLDWNNLLTYYSEDSFVLYFLDESTVKMLCLDPSKVLEEKQKGLKSAIFFSATLSPMNYHQYFLGAGKDAHQLKLGTPFNPDHLLVLHHKNIKTTYRYREENIPEISRSIETLVKSAEGNYLFFFPSYNFLNQCYDYMADWDKHSLIQERRMSPKKRKNFLNRFYQDNPVHGYVVMGGIFSEGIDLIGDALKGAVITTIGLPGLSKERDFIVQVLNKKGLPGFDFAYTIPGAIKIMQSAGRIIRNETDRGVLLLIDERYGREPIKSLLPSHWNIITVNNYHEIEEKIKEFWK